MNMPLVTWRLNQIPEPVEVKMTKKEPILLAWSSGKDSARALHELKQQGHYEIVGLLTTATEEYDRVSMHGVRVSLLRRQSAALGIPLELVWIPGDSSNELYEQRMEEKLLAWKAEGIRAVAFGDIFLEDLRKHREENMAKIDMKAVFPIWKCPTRALVKSNINLGFKAVVTCVDTQCLDAGFAGREIDDRFVDHLPPGIDPCGENGEFHSFAYDGPIFKEPIPCTIGEASMRGDRFCFCDVLEK